MSENGTELERLKVVIEADSSNYKKEMKGLRNEVQEDAKELDKQKESLKKSMNEQSSAVRKVREQMDKFYGATMKAFKLNNGNKMKQFANPLAKLKDAKQFENPLKRVLGERGMEELRNPLVKVFGSQKELEKNIAATERQIQKLISSRDELESTGGDIEMTAEFKDLSKAAEQAEKRLNSLLEKKARLEATGGLTIKNQRTLNYDISQAENELKFAKAAIDDMPTSERYQNTEKWQKLNREIGKCRTELAQYHAQEQKVRKGTGIGRISKSFSSLYAGLKKVTPVIKKVSGAFAAMIQKFKNSIPIINRTKNSMGGFGGLGGMFKTIGMTARFMFASFLIQGVLGQAKVGLQNLAQYSNQYGTQFNSSVNMMYSALKQLQNALATAFAPIVNVVAPYITTLINYLTMGANALAQFFSALTGSKTWTRATYNTQNYAASLDSAAGAAKKLKNELYGFDEITKQSDDDSGSGGSGGSGGGGISPGDMFTEEAVNNQFADFANMVKDAWKKADFTEIGDIVGNKLNNALSNIKWDKIKETTKRIASSVATFLNGFIRTTDWNLVGGTIAEGINTAVLGVHTFLTTFNWTGLGGAIATTMNGFIDTKDFAMIGETVAAGVGAAVDTWHEFVTTFHFDKLGEKIGTSISSFFESMGEVRESGLNGWQELGDSFSTTITGIAESITRALDTVPWEEVGQAIADFICGINWGEIFWDLGQMALSLGGAILDTAAGLGKGLTASLVEYFTGEKLTDEQLNMIPDAAWKTLKAFPQISWKTLTAMQESGTGTLKALPLIGSDSIMSLLNPSEKRNEISLSSADIKNAKSAVTKLKKTIEKTWGKLNLPVGNKFETLSGHVSGWFSKVIGWWGEKTLPIRNKFETLKNTVVGWFSKVKGWWGDKKLSVSNKFETLASHVSGWFSKVKGWWGNKSLPISNKLETNNGTVAGWASSILGMWNNNRPNLVTGASVSNAGSLFSGVENIWNSTRRDLSVTVNAGLGAVTGGLAALLNLKADGGIYAGGRWQPVTAYANGGTPNTGQLFVAREAGPELVGTIGGNTAVMNNNQIVASVAAGVSGAVYNAVVAAMTKSGGSSPEINVYVGGKKITDVVIEEVNKRTKATGVSPIMV